MSLETSLETPLKKSLKTLILFAHPSQRRSEVNRPLFEASNAVEGVTLVDLYAEYPTFRIDIEKEQQRLIEHDIIVFMFPVYWYSTPSILKEWQDLVLEYGFAYGSEGTALHGKIFFAAVSAGGSEKAYQTDGYNHFTIRELLRPLEQTASITGMQYLPPFTLFSARTAADDGHLKQHIDDWQHLLMSLRNQSLDINTLKDAEILNTIHEEQSSTSEEDKL